MSKVKYAKLFDGRIVIVAEKWPGIGELDVYPIGQSRPHPDDLERISYHDVLFSSSDLALVKNQEL